jgi:5-methylcytosine-specific restriction enzyme A
MESFLITFKPQSENPDRGWPLEKLHQLVRRHRAGEHVEEKWRFKNRKDVSFGDRVFLLRQGKGGPAIIGYGKIVREPENYRGKWQVLGYFESIVDPVVEVLATREDILAIKGGQRFWRSQASGIRLPESIASELEALVVGKAPKPVVNESASNPDWTRDELILALNVYLKHRPSEPRKGTREIQELSASLKRLGERLFSPDERAHTFRNENSVYMKLMNFRRLDLKYTAGGKTGLSRGAKTDEDVWEEFGGDAVRCQQVAQAIMASLDDPEVNATWLGSDTDDGIQEAAEGRLLTRKHIVRERNRRLVENKRKQAMKRYGKLTCEACEFDFAIRYGNRGIGFIECHHTKPVEALTEGHRTHLDDLALVCANCHRMIHRERPWLSLAELRVLLAEERH